MKRFAFLFVIWFMVQTLEGFSASHPSLYPKNTLQEVMQAEPPHLANLAFGLGMGQLLAPIVLYGIGLGCFGGCAALVIAAPAAVFVAFGVATFWVSLKALQRIRSGRYDRGQGKAIFGFLLRLAGAVFSGMIFYLSLR